MFLLDESAYPAYFLLEFSILSCPGRYTSSVTEGHDKSLTVDDRQGHDTRRTAAREGVPRKRGRFKLSGQLLCTEYTLRLRRNLEAGNFSATRQSGPTKAGSKMREKTRRSATSGKSHVATKNGNFCVQSQTCRCSCPSSVGSRSSAVVVDVDHCKLIESWKALIANWPMTGFACTTFSCSSAVQGLAAFVGLCSSAANQNMPYGQVTYAAL